MSCKDPAPVSGAKKQAANTAGYTSTTYGDQTSTTTTGYTTTGTGTTTDGTSMMGGTGTTGCVNVTGVAMNSGTMNTGAMNTGTGTSAGFTVVNGALYNNGAPVGAGYTVNNNVVYYNGTPVGSLNQAMAGTGSSAGFTVVNGALYNNGMPVGAGYTVNNNVVYYNGTPVGSLNMGTATGTGVNPLTGMSNGFGLTDGVYAYNPDIYTFIAGRCGSCHSAGQSQPQLDQYALVRANAMAIIPAIETDQGVAAHANLVTTSAERLKFRAWVTAGAPETLNGMANANGFNTNTFNTGMGTSTTGIVYPNSGMTSGLPYDPCNPTGMTTTGMVGGMGYVTTGVGMNTGFPTDPNEGWNELVNPPLLAQCHSQGLVYDRSLERCHKARIATTYSCDRNGILAKFKSVNVEITANFDALIASGYQIDQCGEFNNEPLVLFYARQTADNELKLLYKKFCKSGSAACTNN